MHELSKGAGIKLWVVLLVEFRCVDVRDEVHLGSANPGCALEELPSDEEDGVLDDHPVSEEEGRCIPSSLEEDAAGDARQLLVLMGKSQGAAH